MPETDHTVPTTETSQTPEPSPATPPPTTEQVVAFDPSPTPASPLDEALSYTLTVGEAVARYAASWRRPPSHRSLQRFCVEGRLAAQKIRTTFGAEWLINEHSLARLIESEPVVTAVAGDANSSDTATLATPTVELHREPTPVAPASGDAGDDMAEASAGERRTLGQVLIENARLLAEVEGRDAIIGELKEDRNFLREEVREARRTRDDVKNIAERMLDTLKSMALGRLALTAANEQGRGEPQIIPNVDNRQDAFSDAL